MTEFRLSSFQILPVIIKNIIIINGLMFLAQLTFDRVGDADGLVVQMGWMAKHLALHHILSPFFKAWQLVTHLFMHGSIMHLLGNMFALWLFGSTLENLWGPKRFLIFYLVCGLGAALLHLGFLYYENFQMLQDFQSFRNSPSLGKFLQFYNNYPMDAGYNQPLAFRIARAWEQEPQSVQFVEQAMVVITKHVNTTLSTPTLGASGAVFGCLAAFGYLFPNTYIYLYFFIPIKTKWFVLFYIGFELIMAINNSAGGGVARWAHIGGALFGFLLVYFWNKTNRKTFY